MLPRPLPSGTLTQRESRSVPSLGWSVQVDFAQLAACGLQILSIFRPGITTPYAIGKGETVSPGEAPENVVLHLSRWRGTCHVEAISRESPYLIELQTALSKSAAEGEIGRPSNSGHPSIVFRKFAGPKLSTSACFPRTLRAERSSAGRFFVSRMRYNHRVLAYAKPGSFQEAESLQ